MYLVSGDGVFPCLAVCQRQAVESSDVERRFANGNAKAVGCVVAPARQDVKEMMEIGPELGFEMELIEQLGGCLCAKAQERQRNDETSRDHGWNASAWRGHLY